MATHDGVNYYFSGQGVLMLAAKDKVTGEPMGLKPVGNVPEAKISISTSVVDHKGSQDGQRATDARLQTETKVMISFTIENWASYNLAKALRGEQTKLAAGTVTNQSLVCYLGLISKFAHIKVSSVVVKQGGSGGTTLTAWTEGATTWDYKLNADAGSIQLNDASVQAFAAFVPGSPVSASYTLTVSYSYAEQYVVNALTQPLSDSWFRFEGLNTVDENSPVIIDVFKMSTDPLKELSLISDAIQQFVLEGSVLADSTKLTGSKFFNARKLS
jgi:hypothetical protein